MATRPTTSARPSYERRLILFIDFLGFREVVASTERDPKVLARLIRAMDVIGDIGGGVGHRSERVTQFSDSVVLSYRVDEPSGVFWLLNAMALAVVQLASLGYLLRGAVTVGDLYHTRSHVVGPAMVRAYEMESRTAVFPRVIVDPAVLAFARLHHSETNTPAEEERYVRDFLARDSDGHLFFDYVSWNSVVAITGGEDDHYPEYLATIGHLVAEGLAHPAPGVVEKYLWLHGLYRRAVDLVAALPADHPYRVENPHNCAAIADLSTCVDLAEQARRRVAESRGTAAPPAAQLGSTPSGT